MISALTALEHKGIRRPTTSRGRAASEKKLSDARAAELENSSCEKQHSATKNPFFRITFRKGGRVASASRTQEGIKLDNSRWQPQEPMDLLRSRRGAAREFHLRTEARKKAFR